MAVAMKRYGWLALAVTCAVAFYLRSASSDRDMSRAGSAAQLERELRGGESNVSAFGNPDVQSGAIDSRRQVEHRAVSESEPSIATTEPADEAAAQSLAPTEAALVAGLRVSLVDRVAGSPATEQVAVTIAAAPGQGDFAPSVARRQAELNVYVLSGLAPGEYHLNVESEWYEPVLLPITFRPGLVQEVVVEVDPTPRIRFQLLAGDKPVNGDYQVSRLGSDLHVPTGKDGVAEVPLPIGIDPICTVHGPESLEIVALFRSLEPRPEPYPIRVDGGAGLTVDIVGEKHTTEDLVLVLMFASSLGYEAFVTHRAELGGNYQFSFLEDGPVWVDVGVQQPDRTIQPLGRTKVHIRSDAPASAIVDLGSQRTFVYFESEPGVRIKGGSLWLAAEGDIETSPVGGVLDGESRILVPRMEERAFFATGMTAPGMALVADVQCYIDSEAGGEFGVVLGVVEESFVELLDTATNETIKSWEFDIVGCQTAQFCAKTQVGPNGEPATIRWHSRGQPGFALLWDGLWSPKGPFPITPGRNQIPITQRSTCTFTSPGHTIDAIRHVPTGLEDAGLLAYGGVDVTDVSVGRRYSGIPAGTYMVRLRGEEAWRGPFFVANQGPVEVLVPGD